MKKWQKSINEDILDLVIGWFVMGVVPMNHTLQLQQSLALLWEKFHLSGTVLTYLLSQ